MEGGEPWKVQDVNPTSKVYTNLPSVAFVPGGCAMLGNNSPVKIVKNPHYQSFISSGKSEYSVEMEANATMRLVQPNRANVEKSLAKCDVLPVYPDDDLQDEVEILVDDYLAPILRQTTLFADQIVEFNFQASPGKFWKRLGCKTKGDVLRHPLFVKWVEDCNHAPLVDYCGKVEFLPFLEIVEELKIRGFFNPVFDFNVKMKILYENQNNALLDNNDWCWIKYGLVKQYGGFDRLGKSLEIYDFHDEDDCVGFDRQINLVTTYNRRNKFLRYTVAQYAMLCYVLAFILLSLVLCPDGIIRVRQTGNDSGRNNTTSDNSMAHLPILFRMICKLWLNYSHYRRLPTLAEIMEHHFYAVFSDDALGGHKLEALGVTPEQFIMNKAETYLEFGMKLKPKQHFHSVGKGKLNPQHSFLGSYFVWDDEVDQYIPYPRVEKLASLIYYVEKKQPNETIIVRAIAILVLAAPIPWLYKEVSNYLDFLLETLRHDSGKLPEELLRLVEQTRNNPKQWFVSTLGR